MTLVYFCPIKGKNPKATFLFPLYVLVNLLQWLGQETSVISFVIALTDSFICISITEALTSELLVGKNWLFFHSDEPPTHKRGPLSSWLGRRLRCPALSSPSLSFVAW